MTNNTFFEYKNTDLMMEVLRKRNKTGLNYKEYNNIGEIDHPLKGRKLFKYNGEIYTVDRVFRQWYWGWYIKLSIEQNGSHDSIFWENISCGDETIIDMIEKTRKRFTVI